MINPRPDRPLRRWAVVTLVAAVAVAGWVVATRLPARLAPDLFGGGGGFVATGLTFVDEKHGWALGWNRCGHPRFCLKVERTQDGGRTWRGTGAPAGVGPPPSGAECTDLPGKRPCVDHVVFADLDTGYLWSALSLYVTLDGGRSWRARPGGAAALVATDTSVLRAGAASVESSRTGSDAWRPVTPAGSTPMPYPRLVVAAQRPATVLLEAGTAAPSPGAYISRNRGATWSPLPGMACGPPGTRSGNAASLAPDGTLAVYCSLQGVTTDPGRVFVSHDSGRTYEPPARLPESGRAGARRVVAVSSRVLLYLLAADLLRSTKSVAYRSTDAGRTWREAATPNFDDAPVFVTASFGFALTANQGPPVVTTDGGAHWQERPVR